jgi:hypothetical protein
MKPPKRERLTKGDKLRACLIKLGLDPDEKDVEWHHEPPLGLRPYSALDYNPPQRDPYHIAPMKKAEHRDRTHGRKGESKLSIAGGDQSAIAKTKRLEARRLEAPQTVMWVGKVEKPSPRASTGKGRPLQGRGFGKQHRPLRNRNNLKRHP